MKPKVFTKAEISARRNAMNEIALASKQKSFDECVESMLNISDKQKRAEEIAKAYTIMINDYFKDQPNAFSLNKLMFNPADRNGNTFSVRIGEKTGKAYRHAPGTPAPAQTTSAKLQSIGMERISWVSQFDIQELENDFLTKVLNDAESIRMKIELAKLEVALELIDGSIKAGSATYIKAASLTSTALWGIMKQMANKTNIKAIIGMASLVGDISDFSGFSEATKEQIDNNGFLGTYRGASVIAIKDHEQVEVDAIGNRYAISVTPNNKLWLVGEKCGYEGDTGLSSIKYMEGSIPAEVNHTYCGYGAMIIEPDKMGVVEIGD